MSDRHPRRSDDAVLATVALGAENLNDAARIIRAYEGNCTYPSALADALDQAAEKVRKPPAKRARRERILTRSMRLARRLKREGSSHA